jgi:hypothetical protein
MASIPSPGHPSDPALRHPDADQGSELNSAYPDTVYAGDELPAQTTREHRTATVTRLASSVELLVGVWLAISPWIVGFGGSPALKWNNVVVGSVLALNAIAHLVRPHLPRTPWLSFSLGAWTIIAAFVLSFQNGSTGTAPLWNAIFCGAALTAAAAWSTTETERAALRQG